MPNKFYPTGIIDDKPILAALKRDDLTSEGYRGVHYTIGGQVVANDHKTLYKYKISYRSAGTEDLLHESSFEVSNPWQFCLYASNQVSYSSFGISTSDSFHTGSSFTLELKECFLSYTDCLGDGLTMAIQLHENRRPYFVKLSRQDPSHPFNLHKGYSPDIPLWVNELFMSIFFKINNGYMICEVDDPIPEVKLFIAGCLQCIPQIERAYRLLQSAQKIHSETLLLNLRSTIIRHTYFIREFYNLFELDSFEQSKEFCPLQLVKFYEGIKKIIALVKSFPPDLKFSASSSPYFQIENILNILSTLTNVCGETKTSLSIQIESLIGSSFKKESIGFRKNIEGIRRKVTDYDNYIQSIPYYGQFWRFSHKYLNALACITDSINKSSLPNCLVLSQDNNRILCTLHVKYPDSLTMIWRSGILFCFEHTSASYILPGSAKPISLLTLPYPKPSFYFCCFSNRFIIFTSMKNPTEQVVHWIIDSKQLEKRGDQPPTPFQLTTPNEVAVSSYAAATKSHGVILASTNVLIFKSTNGVISKEIIPYSDRAFKGSPFHSSKSNESNKYEGTFSINSISLLKNKVGIASIKSVSGVELRLVSFVLDTHEIGKHPLTYLSTQTFNLVVPCINLLWLTLSSRLAVMAVPPSPCPPSLYLYQIDGFVQVELHLPSRIPVPLGSAGVSLQPSRLPNRIYAHTHNSMATVLLKLF